MTAGIKTLDELATAKRKIEDVRDENHAFYSTTLGQGALKDLQQTFPHPWLYVGKLLQNAVDARARKIRLATTPETDALIFEHDGAPFEAGSATLSSVRRLIAIGTACNSECARRRADPRHACASLCDVNEPLGHQRRSRARVEG